MGLTKEPCIGLGIGFFVHGLFFARMFAAVPKEPGVRYMDRLRHYYPVSNDSAVSEICNAIYSLFSCMLVIADTYKTGSDQFLTISFTLDTFFCTFWFLNFFVGFYMASSKMRYLLSLQAFVDVVTVGPTFIILILDMTSDSSENQVREYEVLKIVRVLRLLRLSRTFDFLTSRRPQSGTSAVNIQFMKMILNLIVALMVVSGFFNFLVVQQDIDWGEGQGHLPFHSSMYFCVVAFTTVGFGDLTPPDALGRLIVITMIITFVCLIPVQTARIVYLISIKPRYNGHVSIDKGSRHLILSCDDCGIPSAVVLLKEMSRHLDRALMPHVVLLVPCEASEATKALILMIGGESAATYLRGDARSAKDLARARVERATAVFIISDRFAADTTAQDGTALVRAVAVKQAAPDVRLYCLVSHGAAREQLARLGVAPAGVVCQGRIVQALAAHACTSPGFSTLLTNMITNSEKDVDALLGVDRRVRRRRPAMALLGRASPEARLAARADGMPPGEAEYLRSLSYTIVRFQIGEYYSGDSFSTVAELLHTNLGFTLLALAVPAAAAQLAHRALTSMARLPAESSVAADAALETVMLHPGQGWLISPADAGFVMVTNRMDVHKLNAFSHSYALSVGRRKDVFHDMKLSVSKLAKPIAAAATAAGGSFRGGGSRGSLSAAAAGRSNRSLGSDRSKGSGSGGGGGGGNGRERARVNLRAANSLMAMASVSRLSSGGGSAVVGPSALPYLMDESAIAANNAQRHVMPDILPELRAEAGVSAAAAAAAAGGGGSAGSNEALKEGFGGLPPPAGERGVLVMTQGLGGVQWVVRSLLRQRYKVLVLCPFYQWRSAMDAAIEKDLMDIAAAAATGELLVVRNSLTSKGLRKCGLALHNIGTVLIAGGQAHESEMGRECDEATVALLVMVLSTVGPDVRVISLLNVSQFVEQHEMLSRRVRLATGKARAASGDVHGSAVVAVAAGLGRAASDASCKSGALAPSLPQLNHFSLKSGYMCGDVCLASLSEGLLLQAFLQQGSDALVEGLLGPVRGARRVCIPAAFWEWCEAGGAAPTYGDLFFWLLDRFDCITLGLQRRCAEGAALDRSQHGSGGDAGYNALSIANPRASLALEPGDRAFVLLPRGVAEHLAEAAQQAAERFIASTESLQQQEYESFRRERTPGRGRSPSPASANGGDASRSRPPTPEARSVNGGGSPPQRIGGGGGGADAPGRAGMRQAAPAWPSALPLGPVPGRSPSPAHAARTSLFTAVLGPGNNNTSTDTIPAIIGGGGGGADAGTPLPQGRFFGDAPRMLRSARSSSDAAADMRGSGGSGSAAAAAAAAADAALAAWAVRALVARSPQSVQCEGSAGSTRADADGRGSNSGSNHASDSMQKLQEATLAAALADAHGDSNGGTAAPRPPQLLPQRQRAAAAAAAALLNRVDSNGSAGDADAAAAAAAAASSPDAAASAAAASADAGRVAAAIPGLDACPRCGCAFAPAHDCVLLGCGHVTCSACLTAAASAGDIAQCWRCLEPVRLMLVLPPPAQPSEPS